ncbi:uncharacterized protein LOC117642853 isoform X5 [Thrips palmi]|uniref:Uncharacterized protein LOC117642853 isoform X5 n=1 Tax=Thrips palmi TaxID=161013 RepID=A0A6P8ZKM1_THRPL|nr:uncharacterized protein LOC117642853 isoform X5 [Thrips palmi]
MASVCFRFRDLRKYPMGGLAPQLRQVKKSGQCSPRHEIKCCIDLQSRKLVCGCLEKKPSLPKAGKRRRPSLPSSRSSHEDSTSASAISSVVSTRQRYGLREQFRGTSNELEAQALVVQDLR